MTQEPTPPKRIWKCAGCGLQMPGDCSCVTNVATSWEPDHMMVFKDQLRLETTSENIARDMSEGRFPERSEPQVVVIPEAERKTILAPRLTRWLRRRCGRRRNLLPMTM